MPIVIEAVFPTCTLLDTLSSWSSDNSSGGLERGGFVFLRDAENITYNSNMRATAKLSNPIAVIARGKL
jgi:hypothetical protein